MKNLHLWDVSANKLKLNAQEEHLMCYGHDDANSGELYICSNSLVVSSFGENGEETWRTDLSELATQDNRPVNVTLLSLTNDLCVGLRNGEIVTIGDLGARCRTAGVCGNGLLAMEWSPDQELFALITKDMSMILMSCTFDPIYEVDLFKQEFGEKQFITVGWGKKETQFHGSEGKHARVKAEVTADPNAASDNSVKITWRGDGNLYAIGFTIDGIRHFKVFDREGHLQYTSEKQPGLEANLAWRPSGNVIATTQRMAPDKYVVAFFEKNGLKHGGFDIPVSSSTVVEDLQWSSDSEILMLQCKDAGTNAQTLLLFTMANYHWYLKQSLIFNREQCISKTVWDNDFDVQNNKKLHVILCNGEYISYSWIWSIDHSRGKDERDDAIVAVIDGKKLLVTGFRQAAIPPPMAALELELDSFVNSVNFAPPKSVHGVDTNSFFVTTTDHKMIFFDQTSKFPLQYKEIRTVELDNYKFPLQNYNWYWLNYENLISIRAEKKDCFIIMQYNVKSDKLVEISNESLPAGVLRIESHPIDLSVTFLQLNNGDIIQYNINGMIHPKDMSFASPCPKFGVFVIEDTLFFVGLSHKGNLYIDDAMIMNNVSSFFVHSHFLLITTLQHVLLCTELTEAGVNAIKEYSKNESAHVYKRKIERGAKLVIAVPDNTRTVFQMPRGNLETIQPRPLTLKIVGKYLDFRKFHEAFDLMRKERINLNLIYDHNPKKFILDIKEFIEIINNDSWLSLFITELENEDVTKTMYSSSYADRNDSSIDQNNNTKILNVCREIEIQLLKRDYIDCRILPVLTAYVKVKDLESALLAIKDLREQEAKGNKITISSDEALKYLLYMVDVNRLFDAALGIYDFDLVLVIANKSQKDPKEYIPMLNEWSEMEDNYKRFTINKYLKRFPTAVSCLAKCGSAKHEELRTFVKYHSLYVETLPLFKPEEDIYKQISDDFGLYLTLKKQYLEAGLVSQRSGNYEKAIDCYYNALEWELAINLAQMWPKSKFQDFCWDLANELKEKKRYKEALTILEHYYEDEEETILFAIAIGQYKTALRLCTKHEKTDLKNENLLSALLDEHKRMQELVDTNTTNFRSYRDRLRVIRENKRRRPVEAYDPYENRDCDLYSDAGSTVASSSKGSSSRSFRSSKNRRKHERKVASLKQGSQYEDVALVMTLYTLVTSSFELRPQARELGLVLRVFGKDEEGAGFQTSLATLLSEMKDSLKEIWTNELVLEATNATIAAESIPEGSTVIPQGIASLEPHMRIAPIIKDTHWKLHGLFT